MRSDGAPQEVEGGNPDSGRQASLHDSPQHVSQPELPRQDENAQGDGSEYNSSDPAMEESAWEQAAAARARSAQEGGNVHIVPTETLDLRIFCGTWNVAGK